MIKNILNEISTDNKDCTAKEIYFKDTNNLFFISFPFLLRWN